MSTAIIGGIPFPAEAFRRYGYLDPIEVGGVVYPRWMAILVAAQQDAGRAVYSQSTTNVTLPVELPATRVFALTPDRPFAVGAWVMIASQANPTTAWMYGQVTDRTDGQLTVSVTVRVGAGAAEDWVISTAAPVSEISVDVQAALDAASRAEAARDAAMAAGNVFASTALGIAGTADQAYFTTPSADPTVALRLYRNDAGSATHIVDFPSLAAILVGTALNRRMARWGAAAGFEAGAVQAVDLVTGATAANVAWSIAARAIQITGATGPTASTSLRGFWRGDEWFRDGPLEAKTAYRMDANSGSSAGPFIAVGEPGGAIRVFGYVDNSGLGEFGADGASIDVTGVNGLTFTNPQIAELRLVSDRLGTGFVEAISPSGERWRYPFTGLPAGRVFTCHRTELAGTILSLAVSAPPEVREGDLRETLDRVRATVDGDDYPSMLPSDWRSGLALSPGDYRHGWAPDGGAGSVAASTWPDGRGAITLVGPKALRVLLPLTGSEGSLAFGIEIGQRTNPSTDSSFTVEQHSEFSGAVYAGTSLRRRSRRITAGRMGGTVQVHADARSVLFYIGAGAGETVRVALPSLARGTVVGFRPVDAGVAGKLRNHENRIAALELFGGGDGGGGDGVSSVVRLGASILPNYPDPRPTEYSATPPPPGFTGTGVAITPSGIYAGCLLVGDHGKIREGDSSPYAPAVHVMPMDGGRILFSRPLGWNASVQGIVADGQAPETFWMSAASDKTIRRINPLTGVEVTGDRFNWATATWQGVALGSNPNACGYDPSNDTLITSESSGTMGYRIACDPGVPDRVLDGWDWGQEVDHVFVDGDPRYVFFTPKNLLGGGLYADDTIWVRDMVTGETTKLYTFEYTQSLEGFVIIKRRLVIGVSDAGYHDQRRPALNELKRWLVPALQIAA